jgi:hypothetical protein
MFDLDHFIMLLSFCLSQHKTLDAKFTYKIVFIVEAKGIISYLRHASMVPVYLMLIAYFVGGKRKSIFVEIAFYCFDDTFSSAYNGLFSELVLQVGRR